MSQVYRISGDRTHAEPLDAHRAGVVRSQVFCKKAKFEIQQSRRDGAEAIPGPLAGPDGPNLVPAVPAGGHPPQQNGGIWYQ